MDSGLTVKALIVQSLLEGPAYGQSLVERVRLRSRGRIRLREGSLYPTLRALEGAGALRTWVIRAPGARGRPRRYYELTSSGLAATIEQRELVASFCQEPAVSRPSRAEARRMVARLRSCFEVSRFLQDLNTKATQRAAGAK